MKVSVGRARLHVCAMSVEGLARVLLVIIFVTVGVGLETPGNVSDVSGNSAETVCSDFVNILLDHLLNKLIASIPEPYGMGDLSSAMISIKDARLSGLKNVKRRGSVEMQHQEIWKSRGDKAMTSLHNKSVGKADEAFLNEWRRKQDLKLGDVLKLTVRLEIPSNISLQGVAQVQWFGSSYDPESILIALCDMEIKVDASLYLNTTGRMGVELNDIRVEKLGKIVVQDDDQKREDGHEDYLSELDPDDQDSTSGVIGRNKQNIEWLLNELFHSTLVYMLETMLKDSLSAMILKQQERG